MTTDFGQVTYDNSVVQCERIPLFAGALSVEWHGAEVALGDLIPGVDRRPLRTDVIQSPPMMVPPDGTMPVNIPPAPPGASWIVLVHKVSDNPNLDNATLDFLEFELPPPAPPAPPVTAVGGWGAMLLVGLLLVGAIAYLRRAQRAR